MPEETKKCPFCGKEINIIAKKCRFCGQWLNEQQNNEEKTDIINQDKENIEVPSKKEIITCPACGEAILQTAKKCKHCGEWLNSPLQTGGERQLQQPKNKLSGFDIANLSIWGVMFLAILAEFADYKNETPEGFNDFWSGAVFLAYISFGLALAGKFETNNKAFLIISIIVLLISIIVYAYTVP